MSLRVNRSQDFFGPRVRANKLHGVAKVAMAHKLAVRLYWMLRSGQDFKQVMERGSHVGQSA